MNKTALEHLEDAEAALMSFMVRAGQIPDDAPDDEVVDFVPAALAILRSVSRAAGILQAASDDE